MKPVCREDARRIADPACRAYVQRFVDDQRHLEHVMGSYGVPLESAQEEHARLARTNALLRALAEAGARERNDGKSISFGFLSPACERCRTGVRSVSEFISLACNRSCWFCFNPNQCDYDRYRAHRKDWRSELVTYRRTMGSLDFVALTGGEPLLFEDETLDFFEYVRTENPQAHTRLYTSEASAQPSVLRSLAARGLDEIRFSIKLDDPPEARARALDGIEAAVGIVPAVVIEMPVFPGTETTMAQLITELDARGVSGMNLLELCFPLHHANAFRARNLKLVRHPFRVPYDYGYAGALPVAGSEELALRLMLGARKRGVSLGLHYCSLENKNTAQIYEQNGGGALDIPSYRFSPRSFFYETVRAFGEDARTVRERLESTGAPFAVDEGNNMIAFDPALLAEVSDIGTDAQLYLASAVIETDENGKRRFRDVGLQAIDAKDFPRIAEVG